MAGFQHISSIYASHIFYDYFVPIQIFDRINRAGRVCGELEISNPTG
jgi:hypothetical protein